MLGDSAGRESKQLKREIIKRVSSNAYLVDGKIELELRKPFDSLMIQQVGTQFEKTNKGLSKAKFSKWLQRLECICRYFAFDKRAFCSDLRLEERMSKNTDEWVMG